MDTDGELNKMGKKSNNKGITLVYIAIMIVALVAFVGLAVDLGYMYVVKGQLQIAADASSLAAVPNLDGTTNVAQPAARQAAWSFACNNKAAQSGVLLGTGTDCTAAGDLNPTNDVNGDIVVGYWDGTLFTPGNGTNLINAVQVRANKTVNAPEGRFAIFFGKIFALLGGQGWPTMTAGGFAIATLGLPVLPIPICLPRCDVQPPEITDFSDPNCPGRKFIFNPAPDELQCGIAWANLNPCTPGGGQCNPPTPKYLKDYLANPVGVNICNKCIRTTQGVAASVLTDFEAAFNKNKTQTKIKFPRDGFANWSSTVTGWKAVIPILQHTTPVSPQPLCGPVGPQPCPGDQPYPYLVVGMAPVIITKVDTPGPDDCPTCTKPHTGITLIGLNAQETPMTTTIGPLPGAENTGCFDCQNQNSEINALLGLSPRLVK